MIPDLLNWIGSHWGRQHEALVCENCGWEDPTDTFVGVYCPSCDHRDTLAYAVTNGDAWQLRYLLWKSKQKWWPQRYYVISDPSERYWAWLGRRWLIREWEGL